MYDAVFSAPGKALLAGGYLVLFPEFSAFSVGLSSRMFAAVKAATSESTELVVKSPQFASEWRFPGGNGTHKNPFLNACYDTMCAYFGRPLVGEIVIYSDDGFHSQLNSNANAFYQRFSDHRVPITEVPKTGLGSSAALVVAVVAAMKFLGDRASQPTIDQMTVHNLAQIAHSHAQGKVGSGFDVATAVFGTIRYSRFPPSAVPSTNEPNELCHAVDKPWKFTAETCTLPTGYEILMGDVAQGSETPGMVKRVLQWQAENPAESSDLFAKLNAANMALLSAMASQNAYNPDEVRASIGEVRSCLQRLTQLSGVPIEPPQQTKLLNQASEVLGVLGGVVPGAGGDDAICLVLDTRQRSKAEILQDLFKIEGVTWMDRLKLEKAGLELEDPAKFR